MAHNNGPSQRQLRVGEQLRHAIMETLAKGKFHNAILLDASHNVTVSEVRTSPDLKNATAYVMTLGGRDFEEILEALNEAAPYIQRQIGKKLTSKFTPRLKFMCDTSFAEAEKINSLLNQVHYSNEE